MSGDSHRLFALDRQVKNIQFRIQQQISLADDDIQRLAEQLAEYKAEIVRREKELNKIERSIDEVNEIRSGQQKRQNATKGMQISQLNFQHHNFIQQLRQQQAEEIDKLQDMFNSKLEQFNNQANYQMQKNFEDINKQIDDLRSQININSTNLSRRNKRVNSFDKEAEDHCILLNNNLILELRARVQAKNEERAENLRQSKEKLTEIVMELEDMEKEHSRSVADRRKALEHMDKVYNKELIKLEQQHQHKLLMLNGHLSEAVKRAQILRRAAHKLEQSNERQLHDTMREIDSMNITKTNIDSSQNLEMEKQRNEQMTLKRDDLQAELQTKEEQLEAARMQNNMLKKDLATVKHQLKFAQKKQSGYV
ncbi:hypothetical protein TVAG_574710 [Trichomonas vaginalis G3]|uniref:Uncharacterized protein n=1 Tax=Trichomonas vaginalis (strain ATCC PRA-98 / G3) TaxID=412133 RepID=A2G0H8_TRIV3|nr:hypothetical protein TVAGG3_0791700 [Trichomonas vaginalis G3]EAX89335.1 hypothetical protein TVAG_574710 [Trichomonas vaginalis G3]KAI5495839.1 hypothetical protein TVAGG3_0791700 [Trichomonas vaginalis G3]|eukprot:XP_001302265.1 hypothetical protein [Trichomonas vaginalis G3]